MLEGPAYSYIPPSILPASKHVISYHQVCPPFGLTFPVFTSPTTSHSLCLCSLDPLFAWYLNLEKVINSYASERPAPPSKEWIFLPQSQQSCLKTR